MAGDFFGEGGQLVRMPWGIVSLVDLYTGFILVSAWMWFRERHWWSAALWTVAMMTLGNLAFAGYVLLNLLTCGGNWTLLLLGARAATAERQYKFSDAMRS